jgi:hypothetical protein
MKPSGRTKEIIEHSQQIAGQSFQRYNSVATKTNTLAILTFSLGNEEKK